MLKVVATIKADAELIAWAQEAVAAFELRNRFVHDWLGTSAEKGEPQHMRIAAKRGIEFREYDQAALVGAVETLNDVVGRGTQALMSRYPAP